MSKLLEINQLQTHFHTDEGAVPSVDGVSFDVDRGETVAVVGESGCGKSVTSLSVLGLVPTPGEIVGGQIHYEGTNLLDLTDREMRAIRGNEIAMIFQEPLTSLNPVLTVGNQIRESILLHQSSNRKQAKRKAVQLLEKVGIPRPENVFYMYPHELSGGMRQRVMIAMAISCRPKLIIADEPTTALDVTIQAQILKLMKSLSAEEGTSFLFITHDLGVVAEMADRVIVMYAGQVVEKASVRELFENPKHPYTRGLLDCTPNIHQASEQLTSIEGNVPSLLDMPDGCAFHPRCPFAEAKCREQAPYMMTLEDRREVRCWLHENPSEERLI